MTSPAAALPPGFRFHPTDEELILHYLRNRAAASPCPAPIVAEVDIYKFNPWELPGKAAYGDREWYFFSPRDRKYPNGFRPNRAAASGYWKATGTDRPIRATKGGEDIGVKKALVFYMGKPPKGVKTDWIMHEYRLAEARSGGFFRTAARLSDSSMRLDDWVLCRIYKKNNRLQASPVPLMDREEEDVSFLGDAISPGFKSLEKQGAPKLPKYSTISDILQGYSSLSQLWDNSPDMISPAAAGNSSLVGQTSVAPTPLFPDSVSAARRTARLQPSGLIAESSMQRQRTTEEGYGDISGPAKRQNCANIHGNTVQRLDGNSLEQHLLLQQLLLNSHLGLQ